MLTMLILIILAVTVCSCAVGIAAYFLYRKARRKYEDDDEDDNAIEMELLDYNERIAQKEADGHKADVDIVDQDRSFKVKKLPSRFENARRINMGSRSKNVHDKSGEKSTEQVLSKREELMSPLAKSGSRILSRTPFNSMYLQERRSPVHKPQTIEENTIKEASENSLKHSSHAELAESISNVVASDQVPVRPQTVRLKFHKPAKRQKRKSADKHSDSNKESSVIDSPSSKP